MLRFLPVLILMFPIIEIAGFIIVGQWIGVLPTIALVLVGIIAGISLMRRQGLGLAMKIRTEIDMGQVPARHLANGALTLLAGFLLLIPGFVTDILALLLFIPQVRALILANLAKHVQFAARANPTNNDYGDAPDTIDLDINDYARKDAPSSNGKSNGSPWSGKD